MGKLNLELGAHRKATEWYLRALWGRGISLRGIPSDIPIESPLSYIQDGAVFLPESVRLVNKHILYYRAAAVHAALHLVYPERRYYQNDYNLLQRTLIGLVEDLLLERHAISLFPGLRRLWLGFHEPSDSLISAKSLMSRLSLSILQAEYKDEHLWVNKGKELLKGRDIFNCSPEQAKEIGLSLANDMGQMRIPLNAGRYENPILYRDDNRCLWIDSTEQAAQTEQVNVSEHSQTHSAYLKEERRGMVVSIAEQGSPSTQSGFEIQDSHDAVLEYQQQGSIESENARRYPEWDYRTHILKQDWCVVWETQAEEGSLQAVEEFASRHSRELQLLSNTAKKIRMEGHQWKRKLPDGEELDLSYMLDAMVSLRARRSPDPRVFMDKRRVYEKNIVVSLLVDLSESTNTILEGNSEPIYQTLKESLLLIGQALESANISFSINGFSSNGRQEVFYRRFKDYQESFDDSKHRLSSIQGSYSTRLGTAIRHSSVEMLKQHGQKKLLLIITDGVPSDIDVYDREYLIQDSHHAVVEARRNDIKPYCMNLDPSANIIIDRIFGPGRSGTLEHITSLPIVMTRFLMRYLHQS